MTKDFHWVDDVYSWIEEFNFNETKQEIILPLIDRIPEGEKSNTKTKVKDRISQIDEVAKVHLGIGLEDHIRVAITNRSGKPTISRSEGEFPNIDRAVQGFQSDLKLARRLDSLRHVLVYVSLAHPEAWTNFVRNAHQYSHKNPKDGVSNEFPGPTFQEIERLRDKYGYLKSINAPKSEPSGSQRNLIEQGALIKYSRHKFKFIAMLSILLVISFIMLKDTVQKSNYQEMKSEVASLERSLDPQNLVSSLLTLETIAEYGEIGEESLLKLLSYDNAIGKKAQELLLSRFRTMPPDQAIEFFERIVDSVDLSNFKNPETDINYWLGLSEQTRSEIMAKFRLLDKIYFIIYTQKEESKIAGSAQLSQNVVKALSPLVEEILLNTDFHGLVAASFPEENFTTRSNVYYSTKPDEMPKHPSQNGTFSITYLFYRFLSNYRFYCTRAFGMVEDGVDYSSYEPFLVRWDYLSDKIIESTGFNYRSSLNKNIVKNVFLQLIINTNCDPDIPRVHAYKFELSDEQIRAINLVANNYRYEFLKE